MGAIDLQRVSFECFSFRQFSFASSIFCPFLFSSVNSKTEVKRERTQWHQFSAWLHQNIISKIHWFFWCLSILLPAVPRRETLLCPVLIWSVHDFIPIIVLTTSIITMIFDNHLWWRRSGGHGEPVWHGRLPASGKSLRKPRSRRVRAGFLSRWSWWWPWSS